MDSQTYSPSIGLDSRSDIELINMTRSGMESAFGELWTRHRRSGMRAAASINSNYDPEDMVQEAFTLIFQAIRRNRGPQEVFRPYLYSVLRSISIKWSHGKLQETDLDDIDRAQEPAYIFEHQDLGGSITGRAFVSLRSEWRSVLWYSEIEELIPSEIAPLLGLTPNATAALAHRAREGFKVAWLQAHVDTEGSAPECEWTVKRLGAYNRKKLTPRENALLEKHLPSCLKCTILVGKIDQLGRNLGVTILPFFLGPAALKFLPVSPAGTTRTEHEGGAFRPRVTQYATSTKLGLAAAVGIGGSIVAVAAIALSLPAPAPLRPETAALPTIAVKSPNAAAPQSVTPTPHQLPTRLPVGFSESKLSWSPALIPGESADTAPTSPHSKPHTAGPVPSTPAVDPTATRVPSPTPAATANPSQTPSLPATAAPTPTVTPTPTVRPIGIAEPVIVSIATNGIYLPVVYGTGVPGATVYVLSGTKTVAQAITGVDGVWAAIPNAAPEIDGTVRLRAYQILAGQTSLSSPLTDPIQLATPTIIAVSRDNFSAEVIFSGEKGSTVEAMVNGKLTGNYHKLDGKPATRTIPRLASGIHILSFRYVDLKENHFGAWVSVHIEVP